MVSVAIVWESAYETGHADIDRQHRELLGLVNQLEAAEADSHEILLRALDHVMEFTLSHFILEEDLMAEVAYPSKPREKMIEQHREFTSYARLRFIEFRAGKLASVMPLQSFLAEWLTGHEFGLDRLLADFIRQRDASS